ncbi:MAG TPA: dTMP kinase [Gemmatimonadales bacterium]|nr:dTMP kinase [Gemmatimonadales bacterium]
MTGFFLVVEGPEGAGKSTLAGALDTRLRAAGHVVTLVREPGGTPLAEAARALALDPGSRTGAGAELFLMLAARADLVDKVIRPQLASGAVVVADRFDLSTAAYQVAGRGLAADAVAAANGVATGGLRPDLTLVLDIPDGVGAARQAAGGKRPDRMEQEQAAFHQRVIAAYRAATGPHLVHLDASRSPADVAAAAWAEIQKRLGR